MDGGSRESGCLGFDVISDRRPLARVRVRHTGVAIASSHASLAFLSDGGEMGALMRAHDWSGSSLGSPSCWPQPLRTAVRLLLNTGHPMYIWWGPSLACLYNDAYSRSIGPEMHPGSLGLPAAQVWGEIWDIIGPEIEHVMSGRGATWHENALVPITRHGRREEVYWTYSYSPIDDEDSPTGVGGVLVVCTETTRAVLAEQRVTAEAARLRQLFEQAPSFMCTLKGPRHIFEFVNSAHRRLFNSADWVGKPVREAFPDLEGQGYYELLDGVYSTGERYVARASPVRYRLSAHEPEQVHILNFIYEPIRDEFGAVTGILCEGFDLTESHAVEEALRHREEQLRLATDAAEIGLWDVDLVTDTLFWPPRVKAMFAISPDVPVSMSDFYSGLYPKDRERVSHAFAAAVDPDRRALYDVEYRTVGKEDGLVRWVAAKGRGMFDRHGKCIRVIGTAIDVTRRKKAEERLRELNETLERRVAEALAERRIYADIVEGTDALILVADMGYRLLAINRAGILAFEQVYGVRPQVGDVLLDLLADAPAQQDEVRNAWGRALSGDPYVAIQAFGDPKLGRRHFEMRFEVLRNSHGQQIGAYQFVYDVTEKLRDQARLAEAEEQLRQAQKIEAVGQLTGGVAHDFNNLLQVISGGVSVLGMPIDGGRKVKVLEGMRRATERGASLTRQLLAFSRRQPLKREAVDLRQYMEEMSEILSRTLRGDVVVVTEFPEDLWPVTVDPNELELAVLNLCVNSRDAMPRGGTITIGARNLPSLRRPNLVGDFVSLSVSDTGSGIDQEILDRVFEPYFTTKEIGKGSGLGLAQVYGFAKQSGGAVEVLSAPGKGTVVSVILARSPVPPLGVSSDRSANGTEHTDAAGAVLLVEDDDEVADLVSEMLQQLGYVVTRTANAKLALATLAEGHPVRLVLSDVLMPGGMNGIELAKEIRMRSPRQAILLTTGYMGASAREFEVGNIELLAKPFEIADLKSAIERALATSRHLF